MKIPAMRIFLKCVVATAISLVSSFAQAEPAARLKIQTCALLNAPCPAPKFTMGKPFDIWVFAVDIHNQLATYYSGYIDIESNPARLAFASTQGSFAGDQSAFKFSVFSTTPQPGVAAPSTISLTAKDLNRTSAPVSFAVRRAPDVPITVSPLYLAFGEQAIGAVSAPQTVTITNVDIEPYDMFIYTEPAVCVSSYPGYCNIRPGQYDFTPTEQCGTNGLGKQLLPGASCKFLVSFKPTGGGNRVGRTQIYPSYVFRNPIVEASGIGFTALEVRSVPTVIAHGTPITLSVMVRGLNPIGVVTFRANKGAESPALCINVPLLSGSATCTVAPDSIPDSGAITVNYDGDDVHPPAIAQLQLTIDKSQLKLSARVSPSTVSAGQPFTISAMLNGGDALSKKVTFYENGTAIGGCTAISPSAWTASSDSTLATCRIERASPGTHTYVVTVPHSGDAGFEQVHATVSVASAAIADNSGMWWGGLAENGWGVSIVQHGATQFMTMFVYDNAGKPIWYAVPSGTWNAQRTAVSGPVYQPTSGPFSAYDATRFKLGDAIGTMTLSFGIANTATLNYNVAGVSGSKSLIRQVYDTSNFAAPLVNDMWWGGDTQNGWGLSIGQQGSTLFPIWYTYDPNGRTTWYAVPGGKWVGSTFHGDIYATSSSPWLGSAYDASKLVVTKVGDISLIFQDQDNAVMMYNIGGVQQFKSIGRLPF